MTAYTLKQIAAITGGELHGPEQLQSRIAGQVITDSRTFFGNGEALFFALKGPRNNGHFFIPELLKKGVQAFVVSEKEHITSEAAFILVENTTIGLQKLAAFNRQRFNYPVVGITGSNGKTIVKEWLFELLSHSFQIVRSPKSYNSQIGVPLSVLLMNENYTLALIEAGISKPGEMQQLQKIVEPEIGILTNIGDAHQENFDSRKHKTEEKLKLFSNAKQLVFRVDDAEVNLLAKNFCRSHSVEKVSWSLAGEEAFIQFKAKKSKGKTIISAGFKDNSYLFSIPFTDESAIENACHCFALIVALEVKPEDFIPRFQKLAPVAMRLEIKKGINNCLLVNDYYNSDLTSLKIALSVLHQQAKKGYRKKQVILSDIQQTGLRKPALYKQVNELLEEWKINELIGIGPEILAHQASFTVPKKIAASLQEFEDKFDREQFENSAVLIKGAREFRFEKISALLQQKSHQTLLEINLNALTDNLNKFRALLKPETKIMVMVKAFSYGSGDTEIAKLLQFQNVDYLAVAVADEGVELRNAGIQIPIIVMNPELQSFQHLTDYRLEPNIYSLGLLRDFIKFTARNAVQNFPAHLKIDTGMNRLGLKSDAEIQQAVEILQPTNTIKIKSVFSHLAASDDPQFDEFTREQIKTFRRIAKKIEDQLSYNIDRHILNSAGIERFPEYQFEMVRLGIGLYGVSATGIPLENISRLKSTVSQVKTIKEQETVGYGRSGKVEKESRIAVVPLGYADGLDRKLGNGNGSAVIHGQRVPIIGNVCMDMLMLDVTGVDVKPGDEAEFFGSEISVSEMAEKAGTIPYEILTGISQRVKRVYLQD
ncbi:MAG: bifunctional UDP-N-acetylmuramoyl-tripeptide:D-alanyl-D-alanine ligase/alanine racemase [Prolixibacteraceae bacterium]